MKKKILIFVPIVLTVVIFSVVLAFLLNKQEINQEDTKYEKYISDVNSTYETFTKKLNEAGYTTQELVIDSKQEIEEDENSKYVQIEASFTALKGDKIYDFELINFKSYYSGTNDNITRCGVTVLNDDDEEVATYMHQDCNKLLTKLKKGILDNNE